jgi:hypothetical protein
MTTHRDPRHLTCHKRELALARYIMIQSVLLVAVIIALLIASYSMIGNLIGAMALLTAIITMPAWFRNGEP